MDGDNDRQRTVDLGDGELTGHDLRSICNEPGGALLVQGGRITDDLDLSDLTLRWRLGFVDTVFERNVNLTSLACRSLTLDRCHLREGLTAIAARIEGNVTITECRIEGSATRATSRRPSAIWLTDAEIGGRLDIAATTIGTEDIWPRSLHADRLTVGADIFINDGVVFHGEVKLTGAAVGGSILVYGTEIRDRYAALYLSEATIGGNLSVMDDHQGRPSTIDGGLIASGATVAGQLLIHAATVRARSQDDNPRYRFRGARPGVAIDGSRARFDGDVRIYGGSTVAGQISLATTTVEGQLDLDDTEIIEPEWSWPADGNAIELANATLGSDLRFHGRAGSVRLENAEIGGSIRFEDVELAASQPAVIGARNARIGGDVWLDRADLAGGNTDFRLSHVAGDWRALGASLDSSGADADAVLTLTSTEVDGSVLLSRGFEATGFVKLNRCRIGGRLSFDGAAVRSADHAPSPLVVTCQSATVASGLFLDWQVEGTVDFQGTTTNLLVDDPRRWGRGHIIGGFTYQRMIQLRSSGPASSAVTAPVATVAPPPDNAMAGKVWIENPGDRTLRLQWLARQNNPDASTYSHLADLYRRHGRTIDAEEVLVARNRFLRTERRNQGGWRNGLKNLADLMWDVGVGYGYRASRAALVIVALVTLTSAALDAGFARERLVAVDEDNTVFTAADPCRSGTVRCYNPAFYAVDTVVPLVDLHQRSTWYVARNRPAAGALEWGLNVTVLLGWAASSALVLGLTRTLSPQS